MSEALNQARRLAEELRESDAAGYSCLETALMALYFENRRLEQTANGWTVQAEDFDRWDRALAGLTSAIEDRIPLGFRAKLEPELTEAKAIRRASINIKV